MKKRYEVQIVWSYIPRKYVVFDRVEEINASPMFRKKSDAEAVCSALNCA